MEYLNHDLLVDSAFPAGEETPDLVEERSDFEGDQSDEEPEESDDEDSESMEGIDLTVQPQEENWGVNYVSTTALSRWLPPRHSIYWLRMSEHNYSEEEEPGMLKMDQNILEERKNIFRGWVKTFLDELGSWLRTYDSWLSNIMLIPAIACVVAMLKFSKKEFIVSVFCDTILDEAQYILTDPNFHPKDLLMLPKISKKTSWWGCYVDIIVCKKTERVLA